VSRIRVGQGFDAHRLEAGRPLVLGGIAIPFERGLAGHSDGDVLLHAIADALLGALGEGDLGQHFPSSDPAWKGVASREILGRVAARVRAAGLRVAHLDATVVAEAPRLAPHQPGMRRSVAEILALPEPAVSVKVKSSDGLGAIGRGEGMAALATVLLEPAAED
jgi:2-C-methyl-D-erythritol 2,4-cyclodiphosphate synthase